MVEKIIVTPESIRCHGNILESKKLNDYTSYNEFLGSGSENINGQSRVVYSMGSTDYLFVDYGITPIANTTDWYYNEDYITMSRSTTGTTIKHIDENNTVQVVVANKPGTSAGGYDYTKPFSVEVDIISYTAGSAANLQVYDGTNNVYRRFDALGIGATTGAHVKVVVESSSVKFYVDGELQYTSSTSMGGSRIALRLGAKNDTIKFKNFKVY